MERLWQRMLDIYGRQWEGSFGLADGSAFETWCEGIAGLTTQQIKNGLDALLQEGSEYPPNLIKFLRLCRTHIPAYHKPADLNALPPPNIRKDPKVLAAKEKHFEAMRQLLGKQD